MVILVVEEGWGRVFRVEVEELVEEVVETLEATEETRERSTGGFLG